MVPNVDGQIPCCIQVEERSALTEDELRSHPTSTYMHIAQSTPPDLAPKSLNRPLSLELFGTASTPKLDMISAPKERASSYLILYFHAWELRSIQPELFSHILATVSEHKFFRPRSYLPEEDAEFGGRQRSKTRWAVHGPWQTACLWALRATMSFGSFDHNNHKLAQSVSIVRTSVKRTYLKERRQWALPV